MYKSDWFYVEGDSVYYSNGKLAYDGLNARTAAIVCELLIAHALREAECARLRADAARLDWLALLENPADFQVSSGIRLGAAAAVAVQSKEDTITAEHHRIAYRVLIDQAMKKRGIQWIKYLPFSSCSLSPSGGTRASNSAPRRRHSRQRPCTRHRRRKSHSRRSATARRCGSGSATYQIQTLPASRLRGRCVKTRHGQAIR